MTDKFEMVTREMVAATRNTEGLSEIYRLDEDNDDNNTVPAFGFTHMPGVKTYKFSEALSQQMQQMGIDPSDVRYGVFSSISEYRGGSKRKVFPFTLDGMGDERTPRFKISDGGVVDTEAQPTDWNYGGLPNLDEATAMRAAHALNRVHTGYYDEVHRLREYARDALKRYILGLAGDEMDCASHRLRDYGALAWLAVRDNSTSAAWTRDGENGDYYSEPTKEQIAQLRIMYSDAEGFWSIPLDGDPEFMPREQWERYAETFGPGNTEIRRITPK